MRKRRGSTSYRSLQTLQMQESRRISNVLFTSYSPFPARTTLRASHTIVETIKGTTNEKSSTRRKMFPMPAKQSVEYADVCDAMHMCEVEVSTPLPPTHVRARMRSGTYARTIACSEKDDDVCVIISLFSARLRCSLPSPTLNSAAMYLR